MRTIFFSILSSIRQNIQKICGRWLLQISENVYKSIGNDRNKVPVPTLCGEIGGGMKSAQADL